MKHFKVIIIGAGVLGVSAAYHLSRYFSSSSKKTDSVLVIDKEFAPALHASGKNAGMIRHLYHHPVLSEWAERSYSGICSIGQNGIPSELKTKHFRKTGSIILGRHAPNHHEHLFKEGIIHSNASEIPYVYTEQDGLLDSSSYVNDLKKLSIDLGVNYLFKEKVLEILKNKKFWEVKTDKNTFSAEYIINASGAWLNSVLKRNYEERTLELNAYARYLYLSNSWKEKPKVNEGVYGFYWDELNEWYMRDWGDDMKLLSACEVIPADPDNYSHDNSIEELISERVLKSIPEYTKDVKIVRNWHCFRTYAPDKLPVWGEDEELKGLFWLGAFGGFGMSTAFAAAEDAASYILEEDISSLNNYFNLMLDFSPKRLLLNNNKNLRNEKLINF